MRSTELTHAVLRTEQGRLTRPPAHSAQSLQNTLLPTCQCATCAGTLGLPSTVLWCYHSHCIGLANSASHTGPHQSATRRRIVLWNERLQNRYLPMGVHGRDWLSLFIISGTPPWLVWRPLDHPVRSWPFGTLLSLHIFSDILTFIHLWLF